MKQPGTNTAPKTRAGGKGAAGGMGGGWLWVTGARGAPAHLTGTPASRTPLRYFRVKARRPSQAFPEPCGALQARELWIGSPFLFHLGGDQASLCREHQSGAEACRTLAFFF